VQVVQHLRLWSTYAFMTFSVSFRVTPSRRVVVVRDVVPSRSRSARRRSVRLLPFIDVDDAVAAVDFDDRRNQGDHVIAICLT